jgi:hypothetical protein
LNVKESHEGYSLLSKLPDPVGYGQKTATITTMTSTQKLQLAQRQKNAQMAQAMRPGQQILMNAFMMYMSGSQLNIFSISITSMAILTPLSNILTSGTMFSDPTPRLVFVGINLAWLALGLYKMSNMRLLPTTSADWTDKVVWKDMMERTSIPPSNNAVYT